MIPNPFGNQQPGYPPQGNSAPYPSAGYPPAPGQAPGYPSATPGYPPAPGFAAGGAPGYPPAPGYPQAPGYPTGGGSPGYPAQSAPYPGQGAPGYPAAQGYPAAPGYPAQSSPYPGQAGPGYPAASGYPAGPTPGYPGQSPQYPGAPQQGQFGYGAPSGYPAQPAGYPAQPYAAAASVGQLGAAPTGGQTYGMQQYQEVPSIREGQFDPAMDAQALRKAMKGFGTDEAAIINILGRRTFNQRQQINQAFKSGFGRDLIKDLKSELSGRLEAVVVSLMSPRYDFLADKLYKAITGIGTREKTLVDILCTSTNEEIRSINAAYYRKFGKPLENDLMNDTSGCFKKILVSVNSAGRSEDPVANPQMAAQDAQSLYSAGEKRMGTDEETFNCILALRSFAQIRLMLHDYERLTGHGLERAIQNEFSGDIEAGLLAIVKSARNRAAYFAERLHDSLAGMGTKDDDLIFIVVTRAEIDMENIKQEYNKMYHKSLAQDISGDTSGDYKKILLTLIGS